MEKLINLIKKVNTFLNKRGYITILFLVILFIHQNFILESGGLIKGSIFIFITLLFIFSIEHLSIFLITLLIVVSTININYFENGSYVWVKDGSSYKKAPLVYFNPSFWKDPSNLIFRNNNFGIASDNFYYYPPIRISIKKGDFDIITYADVKVSRNTWEEFNFSKKNLRTFLESDIKNKILKSFSECSLDDVSNFTLKFEYDGKKCISSQILNR